MQTKYTVSTNIIRDAGRDIKYIPTPNAKRIVEQIVSDFHKGLRSFNIIGSYGTGKSTFLWALEQSLLGKKRCFKLDLLPNASIEVVNFIGEYKSIISAFAEYLDLSTSKILTQNILSELFNRYHSLSKRNKVMVIVVDEFGKFLEYAAQNAPEKELYFIQQLSEFVNNPDHNILLVTSVHQNFEAYAFHLSSAQKNEWVKVKGRFREIPFNEPIEQLLYLASEHNKVDRKNKVNEVTIKRALTLAKDSKAFSIGNDFASDIAEKLYPLDLMAANVLTISLQRYGQNERSLFSFLESTDHTGISSFNEVRDPFYNVASVYDYLVFNFYSFINSRFNPDFASWSSIKNSLEIVERTFDGEVNNLAKIIKTIGLLNITSTAGALLSKEFLQKYSAICLGIKNAGELIDLLENKKIILYRNYSNRYILFEGTDLDISSALLEAGNKVSEINDVATILQRYYKLPPVFAKSYSYLNGTPRIFEFRISERPINTVPEGDLDGYINLIFNDTLSLKEVKQDSANQEEAILYGFYKNSKTIKNQLFEIEKTQKVLTENSDDRIAAKELNNILLHQENLLNHYILHNLYSKKSEIVWVFKGEEINISSKREFNKFLSQICFRVYPLTPIFRNELVNKHKISSSIHTAKRNFLRALVDNWNKPDLGFEPTKFPPEKTIYQTLLKKNGINFISEGLSHSESSIKEGFMPLWKYSCTYLESAKKSRRSIADFTEPLTRRPFKLKQGLIDFWTASFFFMKRDDFALFGESGYIPFITEEVLELLIKYPKNYKIKAFDIEGLKLDLFNSYRIFLNQASKERLDNQTFIETIKPFLTFYKGLSEYSRTTKRLSKEALSVREAISSARDPEKSFFEDFPLALGYTLEELQGSKESLQVYISQLQEAIRELRTSFDGLINRFEEFILTEFVGPDLPFNEYKEELQRRYMRIKKHLCLPYQKTFLQRLDSELDDRKAWLSSIAQAVIGKSLESIKDDEEILLYERFKSIIRELDNLTVISKADLGNEKEEIISLEISSFVDGLQKSLIRLPKSKQNEISKLELSIRGKLSVDTSLNVAALAKILIELIKR